MHIKLIHVCMYNYVLISPFACTATKQNLVFSVVGALHCSGLSLSLCMFSRAHSHCANIKKRCSFWDAGFRSAPEQSF